ncbi:(2Fe-2S)-binding protein [Roseateles toxinivorans]|uniref:Carbon-monoxide dehydrogenase small subunit n=1 Tax=Roseateles toxinivorans TaxID=270368 RepID=A0A4R6QR24_9BURK|nr:(2Fe-2S)-binding protein [Roseateles toxinivorans]TDP72558.1 carbon-monoxide dehydrogenase small subunit [Roseateles toxinivorans]
MPRLALTINGQPQTLDAAANTLLLDLLRDRLLLTGSHRGCDTAQCGACTVRLNGRAVKACNVLALQADGAHVDTVESLSDGKLWHPMQRAFSKHHGLQCGFCTPGMLMRACAMADEGVPAEDGAVRQALAGNLCRCTGYEGIVGAVCEGMRRMRGESIEAADAGL